MMLRGYRDLSPSYADDIMRMAVAEADSRVEARNRLTKAEASGVTIGAWTGLLVPVLGLIFGFVVILLGHPAASLLAFIPSALIGVSRIVAASRRHED